MRRWRSGEKTLAITPEDPLMLPGGPVHASSPDPESRLLVTTCDCGQPVEAPETSRGETLVCPACGCELVIGTLNAVELAASARQRKNAASWILLVAGLVIMTLGAGLYFTADAFINLVSTQQREVDQRPGAGGIAQPTPRMAKDNMVGRLSTVALGIVTVGLIIAVAGLLKHGTASKRKNPNYKTGPA